MPLPASWFSCFFSELISTASFPLLRRPQESFPTLIGGDAPPREDLFPSLQHYNSRWLPNTITVSIRLLCFETAWMSAFFQYRRKEDWGRPPIISPVPQSGPGSTIELHLGPKLEIEFFVDAATECIGHRVKRRRF